MTRICARRFAWVTITLFLGGLVDGSAEPRRVTHTHRPHTHTKHPKNVRTPWARRWTPMCTAGRPGRPARASARAAAWCARRTCGSCRSARCGGSAKSHLLLGAVGVQWVMVSDCCSQVWCDPPPTSQSVLVVVRPTQRNAPLASPTRESMFFTAMPRITSMYWESVSATCRCHADGVRARAPTVSVRPKLGRAESFQSAPYTPHQHQPTLTTCIPCTPSC